MYGRVVSGIPRTEYGESVRSGNTPVNDDFKWSKGPRSVLPPWFGWVMGSMVTSSPMAIENLALQQEILTHRMTFAEKYWQSLQLMGFGVYDIQSVNAIERHYLAGHTIEERTAVVSMYGDLSDRTTKEWLNGTSKFDVSTSIGLSLVTRLMSRNGELDNPHSGHPTLRLNSHLRNHESYTSKYTNTIINFEDIYPFVVTSLFYLNNLVTDKEKVASVVNNLSIYLKNDKENIVLVILDTLNNLDLLESPEFEKFSLLFRDHFLELLAQSGKLLEFYKFRVTTQNPNFWIRQNDYVEESRLGARRNNAKTSTLRYQAMIQETTILKDAVRNNGALTKESRKSTGQIITGASASKDTGIPFSERSLDEIIEGLVKKAKASQDLRRLPQKTHRQIRNYTTTETSLLNGNEGLCNLVGYESIEQAMIIANELLRCFYDYEKSNLTPKTKRNIEGASRDDGGFYKINGLAILEKPETNWLMLFSKQEFVAKLRFLADNHPNEVYTLLKSAASSVIDSSFLRLDKNLLLNYGNLGNLDPQIVHDIINRLESISNEESIVDVLKKIRLEQGDYLKQLLSPDVRAAKVALIRSLFMDLPQWIKLLGLEILINRTNNGLLYSSILTSLIAIMSILGIGVAQIINLENEHYDTDEQTTRYYDVGSSRFDEISTYSERKLTDQFRTLDNLKHSRPGLEGQILYLPGSILNSKNEAPLEGFLPNVIYEGAFRLSPIIADTSSIVYHYENVEDIKPEDPNNIIIKYKVHGRYFMIPPMLNFVRIHVNTKDSKEIISVRESGEIEFTEYSTTKDRFIIIEGKLTPELKSTHLNALPTYNVDPVYLNDPAFPLDLERKDKIREQIIGVLKESDPTLLEKLQGLAKLGREINETDDSFLIAGKISKQQSLLDQIQEILQDKTYYDLILSSLMSVLSGDETPNYCYPAARDVEMLLLSFGLDTYTVTGTKTNVVPFQPSPDDPDKLLLFNTGIGHAVNVIRFADGSFRYYDFTPKVTSKTPKEVTAAIQDKLPSESEMEDAYTVFEDDTNIDYKLLSLTFGIPFTVVTLLGAGLLSLNSITGTFKKHKLESKIKLIAEHQPRYSKLEMEIIAAASAALALLPETADPKKQIHEFLDPLERFDNSIHVQKINILRHDLSEFLMKYPNPTEAFIALADKFNSNGTVRELMSDGTEDFAKYENAISLVRDFKTQTDKMPDYNKLISDLGKAIPEEFFIVYNLAKLVETDFETISLVKSISNAYSGLDKRQYGQLVKKKIELAKSILLTRITNPSIDTNSGYLASIYNQLEFS